MAYKCTCCGEMHDDWPVWAFNSPDNYYHLTDSEKATIAKLDGNFCVINFKDGTSYFIRVVLQQKVLGTDETLDYGLWVSLSEKSFNDYSEHFEDQGYQDGYFGWLCNDIPGYDFSEHIAVNVHTSKDNKRPIIVPHHSHHPFVEDFENGIPLEEAHRRIDKILSRI